MFSVFFICIVGLWEAFNTQMWGCLIWGTSHIDFRTSSMVICFNRNSYTEDWPGNFTTPKSNHPGLALSLIAEPEVGRFETKPQTSFGVGPLDIPEGATNFLTPEGHILLFQKKTSSYSRRRRLSYSTRNTSSHFRGRRFCFPEETQVCFLAGETHPLGPE